MVTSLWVEAREAGRRKRLFHASVRRWLGSLRVGARFESAALSSPARGNVDVDNGRGPGAFAQAARVRTWCVAPGISLNSIQIMTGSGKSAGICVACGLQIEKPGARLNMDLQIESPGLD
jgi:hypothetical protein